MNTNNSNMKADECLDRRKHLPHMYLLYLLTKIISGISHFSVGFDNHNYAAYNT